jgi:hypothetical protein
MENFNQLSYMVGIRSANNSVSLLGTCFLLPKEGTFVTCHHVIGDNTDNIVIVPCKINKEGYQDTSDIQCNIVDVSIRDINTVNDIVILSLKGTMKSSVELGSLDDILVGDSVEILGYPHCVNDPYMHVLTYQFAIVGAKIIKESQSLRYKYVVLNIQTRPGQSGSLVYCERVNKIIGMLIGGYAVNCGISLSGINPSELNQTSFCISAEYIKEML